MVVKNTCRFRWCNKLAPIFGLFQIEVVGVRGNGYAGDLALDDFDMIYSACDGKFSLQVLIYHYQSLVV